MSVKRIAFLLIMALVPALLIRTNAFAQTRENGLDEQYEMIIDDEADLLSDSEEQMLLERMRPLSRYGTVAFWTTDSGSGGTETMAGTYLSKYVSTNDRFSCTLLMIDMSRRQIWIQCRGAMLDSFGIANSYLVTGNVAGRATSGRYYDCADEAFRQMNEIMKGGRVPSPMRYICSILIALALALLITYCLVRRTMQPSFSSEDAAEAVHADISMEILNARRIYGSKKAISSGSFDGGGGIGGGSSGGGGGGGGSGF